MRADRSRCLVSVTRHPGLAISFHLEQLCSLLVRQSVLKLDAVCELAEIGENDMHLLAQPFGVDVFVAEPAELVDVSRQQTLNRCLCLK